MPRSLSHVWNVDYRAVAGLFEKRKQKLGIIDQDEANALASPSVHRKCDTTAAHRKDLVVGFLLGSSQLAWLDGSR